MSPGIDALLVTSPGCHYCDEAFDLLAELARATPMTIRTIPMTSDEGRSLIVRYRVPFPPILMIDSEFFGHGRISRRKLEALLADSATAQQVV